MAYAVILIVGIVAAYFLGGIPWALIIGKMFGIDLRKVGSGNLGTTNALRNLGWGPGLTVLALDALKGFAAVTIVKLLLGHFAPETSQVMFDLATVIVAFVAVFGHIKTPYLKTGGGKGAACLWGGLFAFALWSAFIMFWVFVLVAAVSKYFSMGTMVSAASLPITCALIYPGHIVYIVYLCIIFVVIMVAHKSNIKRLRAGTETKFKAAKRPPSKDQQ